LISFSDRQGCAIHITYTCDYFANAAVDALKAEGIAGQRVRISAKDPRLEAAIGFDGKSVGSGGFHDWIDVNGKIYDNNVFSISKEIYILVG
jgi:hypothetical protein